VHLFQVPQLWAWLRRATHRVRSPYDQERALTKRFPAP
jgi:hypothetical protein